ncbi:MAG: hypothetical protein WC533_02310 [Candidatus Pacearchaeota archaeon]
MHKQYPIRVGDEKILPLLSKLFEEKTATEVIREKFILVYSIDVPPIAVVARWGTTGTSSGYAYTSIGDEQHIKEFEEMFSR